MRTRITGLAGLLLLLAGSAGATPAETAGDTVLVTGAGAALGQQLVRELRGAGYRVRALVAAAGDVPAGPPDGIDYRVGDPGARAAVDDALRGARYLVAAPTLSGSGSGASPERVFLGDVRTLAEAAAAAGVDRLVLVSSAGVTREDHVMNRLFDDVLAWRARGEEAVRSAGVPYTIIRPGGLTDQDGGQAGVRLEQGDSGEGFVPRADVARVCVAALASPAAAGRTFEVYAARTPPGADWDARFAALAADGAQP